MKPATDRARLSGVLLALTLAAGRSAPLRADVRTQNSVASAVGDSSAGSTIGAKSAPRAAVVLHVEERPGTETVSVRVLIGGGRLAAPAGSRAVADLHASLLLRGAGARGATDLARAGEAMGGQLEAFASARHESVGISVLAAHAEGAISLLADIVLHPHLDAQDLEKEKRLLLGSLATARDDPAIDLYKDLYRALFPDHPLASLAPLEDADVGTVTIDAVRRFHAAQVVPGRLAVVIVGRCDGGPAARAVEAAFGGAGPVIPYDGRTPLAAAPLSPPAPLAKAISHRVGRRTTQPEILIALPTEGISDDEAPAYTVLSHILGGFQERLYTEIREERGYAYWIRMEGPALPTAGWLGVHTGARRKHLAEIERLVRAALDRIASEPAGEEELERARRYLATEQARLDATNEGRASILSRAIGSGFPARSFDERAARLAAVSAEDVMRLARRLFRGRPLAVLTLG